MQFVGEDEISHTAENETISLKLGKAFDISAQKKVVSARRKGNWHYLSMQLEIKNVKDEDVSVFVQDRFYGDWKIIKESTPSTKLNSQVNRWDVKVPTKSSVLLEYEVEIFLL